MRVIIRRMAVAQTLPPALELVISENCSLGELIDILASRFDSGLNTELIMGGGIAQGILVMINGRSAEQTGGLSTVINDGAEVFITAMVHGG